MDVCVWLIVHTQLYLECSKRASVIGALPAVLRPQTVPCQQPNSMHGWEC